MEKLYVIKDASQIIGEIMSFFINSVETPRFINEKIKLDLYFTQENPPNDQRFKGNTETM